jgi:hypothetical protein
MKHKLTVLACVGLALLLSTGFAFAQNVITVESGNVNRCATATVNVYLDNSDPVDAIGLPLVLSGAGTLTGVAAGPALAGHIVAINHQGNRVLLNAAGACLQPGNHLIATLTVDVNDDCQGTISIGLDDPALVEGAGLVLTDCDCCPVGADLVAGTLTLVNQPPVCDANSDENLHFSGSIVDKQLNAHDPDPCDNASLTFSGPISGPGTVSGDGLYNWDPTCADASQTYTVVFRVTDQCGEYVDCSFDVSVYHDPPVCQGVGAQSVHWADHLSVPLPATDDGCKLPLVWNLLSNGGLVGSLSVSGGHLEYDGDCADIAGSPHTVIYEVFDGEYADTCDVDITVTNDAPTVVCPDPIDPGHLCNHQIVGGGDGIFDLGQLVEGDAVGDDINGDPLTYSIISVKVDGSPYVPVNAPTIDANTGHFEWQSTGSDPVGTYEFCIEVDDGCYQGSCCFSVELELNIHMGIVDAAGTADTIPALPGTEACVYVNIFPDIPLGGIDILLCYDMTGLTFLGNATPMNDLADWEYFTWRTSRLSNCGGPCPTGYIRIVAIADLDNGPDVHPPDHSFGLEGNVIELCFLVTSDWNFLGQCLPINFCSEDCGDNALASKDGNIVWLPLGVDPECLDSPKYQPIEETELCPGAICVREPVDPRGDLNLNLIPNEVGDAVLYSRYFIEGPSVWDPAWRAIQEQASDVNNDGVQLTIADLVYLIRIITGDEQPFPSDGGYTKVSPYAGQANAIVKVSNNSVTISTQSAVDIGGAAFVFRYSGLGVGQAEASDAATQMRVSSSANHGELRVLVAPEITNPATISSGTNEIVTIPISGEGSIDLVEADFSDAEGAMLTSHVAKISPPKSYALLQNYPNPFNAGTVIPFDLKDASDWTVTVYNVTGQVVRTFAGHNEASQVRVQWDGTDTDGNEVASGVYFYRIKANNFTASKKMTLLK